MLYFLCDNFTEILENTKLRSCDEIFHVLRNGKWHDSREIAEVTCLSVFKLNLLTNFLAEFKFIEFDAKKQKARLMPSVREFLKKIQEITE